MQAGTGAAAVAVVDHSSASNTAYNVVARTRRMSVLLQCELHDIDAASPKTCFAIGQIKIPGAQETVVESLCLDFALAGLELRTPQRQRVGVIQTEGVAVD